MVTFSGVENMGTETGVGSISKFNPNQIFAPLPNGSNLGESFGVSLNCSCSELRIKRAKQLAKPRLGRAAAVDLFWAQRRPVLNCGPSRLVLHSPCCSDPLCEGPSCLQGLVRRRFPGVPPTRASPWNAKHGGCGAEIAPHGLQPPASECARSRGATHSLCLSGRSYQ